MAEDIPTLRPDTAFNQRWLSRSKEVVDKYQPDLVWFDGDWEHSAEKWRAAEIRELAKKYPNLKIIYALSDELGPEEKWDGETGFIHLAVDKYLEPGISRQAFLCGPPLMIDAATKVLKEKGIKPDDIFYDEF